MSMILEAGKQCPYGTTCPYNKGDECMGAMPSRPGVFTCSFVKDGQIAEGGFRNPLDQTGKMKIITG